MLGFSYDYGAMGGEIGDCETVKSSPLVLYSSLVEYLGGVPWWSGWDGGSLLYAPLIPVTTFVYFFLTSEIVWFYIMANRSLRVAGLPSAWKLSHSSDPMRS